MSPQPELELLATEVLVDELKRRYDVLILYADAKQAEGRSEMYRVVTGGPLAVYGLVRLAWLDADDALHALHTQLAGPEGETP